MAHFSFKNKHSEEFLTNSAAINSEKKERLRSFLESLKPDDNPVLKIVFKEVAISLKPP